MMTVVVGGVVRSMRFGGVYVVGVCFVLCGGCCALRVV